MITRDGWFDWAERLPGRPEKVNGGVNGLLGLAGHSAEGWQTYLLDYQTNPAYATRKASWALSNLIRGSLVQHYSVFAQTWTSGVGYANNNFIGMETEGIAGMPLNDAQKRNVARVLRDLSDFTGRTKIERIGQRLTIPAGILAIVEHQEAVRWGALPTSCPSFRYDWPDLIARANALAVTETDEGEAMFIVHKHHTGDRDSYKAYLVQGKTWRHIPDLPTFEGLRVSGIPVYMPNKIAFDFMTVGVTFIE